jgi:hypothetical protein
MMMIHYNNGASIKKNKWIEEALFSKKLYLKKTEILPDGTFTEAEFVNV